MLAGWDWLLPNPLLAMTTAVKLASIGRPLITAVTRDIDGVTLRGKMEVLLS